MRILLDGNSPKPLLGAFQGYFATTVQAQGLAGTRNGTLLVIIEEQFDVFLTADKNLRYQQNLSGRTVAIVELPTNRLPLIRPPFLLLATTVVTIKPGEYVQITP